MKWIISIIMLFLIPSGIYASPFLISDPNPSCENGICDVEFTGLPFVPPPEQLKTLADGSIRVDLAALPEGDAMDIQVRVVRHFGADIYPSEWVPFVDPGRSAPSALTGLAVSP